MTAMTNHPYADKQHTAMQSHTTAKHTKTCDLDLPLDEIHLRPAAPVSNLRGDGADTTATVRDDILLLLTDRVLLQLLADSTTTNSRKPCANEDRKSCRRKAIVGSRLACCLVS